jgi:hypothetical protein
MDAALQHVNSSACQSIFSASNAMKMCQLFV